MIRPVWSPTRYLSAAAEHLQSPFLLFVRLYWGWQFMQTGWGKLSNIDRFIMFFRSLGLPFPEYLLPVVGSLELVGGFLLILGLFSRLIALPLTVNMLMAYLLANREAFVSLFSDPSKFYSADPYTFLFAGSDDPDLRTGPLLPRCAPRIQNPPGHCDSPSADRGRRDSFRN